MFFEVIRNNMKLFVLHLKDKIKTNILFSKEKSKFVEFCDEKLQKLT